MLRDVRRLLVALVLALSGVVLAQVPAHACKCASSSTERDVKRADEVFTGTLVASDTTRGGRAATVYEIEAETLYKGDLRMTDVRVSSRENSCGLGGLPADKRYVWFVTADGGSLVADQCGGTAPATDKLVAAVEEVRGEGEPLGGAAAAEQEPAEFTRVADADPAPVTRVAAPGAALVLLGLLGLFVVRRRA